jgi:hypothetical protein
VLDGASKVLVDPETGTTPDPDDSDALARSQPIELHVSQCDLSDRRMYVKIHAPQIAMLAPKLLDGYRNPFDGPGAPERAGMRMGVEGGGWSIPAALAAAAREGQGYAPGTEPVVWAGLVVSNSDVGGGARSIAPQMRVKICKNGLTMLADADKKVHLGSEQIEGVIDYSSDTQEKELALITAQARDAVTAFLSPAYLASAVEKVEALAAAPVADPEATIKQVASSVGFTKDEAAGILSHFIRGGQMTAGGVVNAVTSYSQTIDSPDRAWEIDNRAMRVLELAAAN